MERVAHLRGQGRWGEALELVDDPLARADILNEQALFTGSAEARDAAAVELLRAEARLLQEEGRILHARFLAEREREDPRELEAFERSWALAREAGDEQLEAWGRFWIGLVHQIVRGDHEASLSHFEAAYDAAKKLGDTRLQSYAARHLGFVSYERGRRDEALKAFEESAELRRRDGFLPGLAAALATLGEIAEEEERLDDARVLLEDARAAAEQSGAAAFRARIDAALERLPT